MKTLNSNLLISSLMIFLTACSNIPYQASKKLPSKLKTIEHFTATGTQPMTNKWWLDFKDHQLKQLIEQALKQNFSLQSAWERLNQAKATARKAGAEQLPEISGSVTTNHNRSKNGGTNSFSTGLSASYEVDLWGKINASIQTAQFDYLATREALETAAISLAAEVAITWYQLQEQQNQLQLQNKQLKTNQQILELVQLRFIQGLVNASDVLQQKQLIESIRAKQINTQADLQVLRHQLAILLGQSPTKALDSQTTELIKLPPLPDTGIPAQLITRRPDLRQAYYQIMAAEQNVAIAIADQFPQFNLTAGLSFDSEQWHKLFDNWLAQIAADLIGPIFDGGKRTAEVDRSKAAAAEAINDYKQQVLEAFGEVENALIQERQQRAYLESLNQQITLSKKVLSRTREYYIKGAVDFLDILEVLKTLQDLESNQLTSKRQLIEYRIALCRALGGGWLLQK